MEDEYSRAIVFILISAVVVYAQQAWVPGFFFDGYLYAALGRNAVKHGDWLVPHLSHSTYGRFDQHTPFVFILEGIFFKIFGVGYTQARWFSASFAIASLILLMRMLWKEKEHSWAIYSAVLLVIIPPLIKKVRFPNTDIPLMFFSLLTMFFYWKSIYEKNFSNWILAGLCFGLSLLTKGPMAFFLPLAITIHLIATGQLKKLKSWVPWFSLCLGFVLFSIWPLCLWLTDNQEIFYKYLNTTFVYTISKGRGKESFNLFTYIFFLFKQAGPLVLLMLWGIKRYKKVEQAGLFLLFACYFFPQLILLSFTSFKYSHYLIPMYPSLAVMAAFPLSRLSENFFKKFLLYHRWLVITATLAFLCFPITVRSTRDKEIISMIELLEHLPSKPSAVAVVDSVYPFYSVVNHMAWYNNIETFQASSSVLENWINKKNWQANMRLDVKIDLISFDWLFLVPSDVVSRLEVKYPQKFSQNFRKLAVFKKKKMIVLVQKEIASDRQVFIYD